MAVSLLITGTDTGVGKTFVTAGLAGALLRDGFRVAPFKPVETGCVFDRDNRTLIPADARLLESATGTREPLELICPYRFASPLAPWVAAEREGQSIEITRLQQCHSALLRSSDWVLVESAGGILVPLRQDFCFDDLARLLSIPVLVVAGSKLGVLNHTLLTLRHLRHVGVPVIGCVLNHPFGDEYGSTLDAQHKAALESNASALRRLTDVPVWVVPSAMRMSPAELDTIFDQLGDEVIARVPRVR